MKTAVAVAAFAASLLSPVSASPAQQRSPSHPSFAEHHGVKYAVFEHAATNSTMHFVKNSGICETTPGVTQYSGYLSVGTDMNMWFWFFEARNSPPTAPLATWFNGGKLRLFKLGIIYLTPYQVQAARL